MAEFPLFPSGSRAAPEARHFMGRLLSGVRIRLNAGHCLTERGF